MRTEKTRVSRAAVGTVRVLVALIAVGAIVQPFVAGLFVTGDVTMLVVHLMVATALVLFAVVLLIASILYWRPGGGSTRAIGFAAVVTLLIVGQSVLGFYRVLEWHFPVAFVVIGAAIAAARWAWSPEATRPRTTNAAPVASEEEAER